MACARLWVSREARRKRVEGLIVKAPQCIDMERAKLRMRMAGVRYEDVGRIVM